MFDDDRDLYHPVTGEFVGYDNYVSAERDRAVRAMLRSPPAAPKIATDYRPEDTLCLIRAVKEGTTCIIPTCDLSGTFEYLSHYGHDFRMAVSTAEDTGWTRIKRDEKEGKLARELLRELV